MPSGSSKRTSMRESATRELTVEAQLLFGINKSEAAPLAPCCKKLRRFIISVSSVVASDPSGSELALGSTSKRHKSNAQYGFRAALCKGLGK